MAPSLNAGDGVAADSETQFHRVPETEETLNEMYPNRPTNINPTLPFSDLLTHLFNPLNDNKNSTGPKIIRKKVGPHVASNKAHEVRKAIVERFVSKWRQDVGLDFYPALRLILPDKDRERPMYGLKEKAIGKILVRMVKIDKDSDDAKSVLDWKNPGKKAPVVMAGDFAGRCYELLKNRPSLVTKGYGDISIEEVNMLLDDLSRAGKENAQLKIFEKFYTGMSAEEMMWLIRIILRQMKIGASEKTILYYWHPNAEALFNMCSSLRRVCWELTDPEQILDSDETGVELMACFLPQLAQFQQQSFTVMLNKMGISEENPEFWIEEKLDGERMQMHMMEDENHPGGKRFGFWSRKGKDYTYLYGNGFEDDSSALTRHIKDVFDPRIRNIIVDGEMITWDPEQDRMVPFGSLKTAALSEQKNPFNLTGNRPLFRVFDCLYINDKDITRYTLKDRRDAMNGMLKDVHRRFELHHFEKATNVSAIDPALRAIVAESSEGLVLKNPLSTYRLSQRDNVWMKVKPEYMDEFGENLDCVVVGGYWGSGRRGGTLSSFLCGLRVDQNHIAAGANPMKCFSFFKVGGGMRAEDYARINHVCDGKWIDWDSKHPPIEYIELAGGDRQREKPDVWIKPCDSVVLEVKAASVDPSESFKTGYTLRFPRFKKLRSDKDWKSALSMSEFKELKAKVEEECKQREFVVAGKRKTAKRLKKEVVIAGTDSKIKTPYAGPQTKVFEGLDFHVMTDMLQPFKKTKAEIEQIIKANGGSFYASPTAKENIICIAEKRPVKVASLIKRNETNIVRPAWLFDALKQSEIDGHERSRFLVPFEPVHMFHLIDTSREHVEGNVDMYGDSYARDITAKELGKLCDGMVHPKHSDFNADMFRLELEERGRGVGELHGNMFARCVVRFAQLGDLKDPQQKSDLLILENQLRFGGGKVAGSDEEQAITHFVVLEEEEEGLVRELRRKISQRQGRIPRVVSQRWLRDSWAEKTVLDEEGYAL